MKRKIIVFIVIVLFIITPVSIYTQAATNQEPASLTSEEIKYQIDAFVDSHKDTTAAVSVAVFQYDDILLEESYGFTNLENQIQNSSDAVFEWGSCTKLLTWVSVMQQVERGTIGLNEDIRNYLPNGFLTKLKSDEPITMLNLMNHNAGWQEAVTDIFLDEKAEIKGLEAALRVNEPEQVFAPGEFVAYSNWGTALAGFIVERVSGQTFTEYVKENIFFPLGMEHTALSADLTDNSWVLEQRNKENCYTTANESLGTAYYYLSLYPCGGAVGTLSDFMTFAQSFVTKDGTSPLFEEKETLQELLSPSLYYSDGVTARNAHGFWTDSLGTEVLWHNGGTNGSTSWLGFDVVSGTGMVILTNQSEEYTYTNQLQPIVFGEYDGSIVADTEDLSGAYMNTRTCLKGFAKLYSLMCTMGISSDGEGGYSLPSAGITMTKNEDGSYLFDYGVKAYRFFVKELADGRKVLELPGSDQLQVNGYGVLMKLAGLVVFLIAGVYCLVSFVLGSIHLIRRRSVRPFERSRMILDVSVILSIVACAGITAVLNSSAATSMDVRPFIILNALCMVVPFVVLVLMVIKWRKTPMNGRQRIGVVMNLLSGLIMTGTVLYWNVFL